MTLRLIALTLLLISPLAPAQSPKHPSFDIRTRRMDVDVDGAPNAYGPPGRSTLDYLKNARFERRPHGEIVGYLTDDDNPRIPIVQGPRDPFPGLYVSQTAMTDRTRRDPKDPRRYVDATRINYVVLGDEARRRGARIGDFVAVYSARHHRSVFGVVADEGNPSGDEGSLHLLQALGYPYKDGKHDAVERRGEITIRFFPHSNPTHFFPHSQEELNAKAATLHLNPTFPHS